SATAWIELRQSMAVLLLAAPQLLEIFEFGRLLALLDRHQETLRAELVVLVSNLDVGAVLAANELRPLRLCLLRVAAVAARHHPGPRERMVGDCDLVMQDVRIGFVGVE